jgi:Flp pilus assembly protein TadG
MTMLRRIARRFSASERGAAGVEMAMVLPLLVVLTFGAVEIGRMIWQYQIVTKGARDGVRYLTRVPVTCAAPGPGGTFSAGDEDVAKNLVKSGTKTASTPIMAEYASAVFEISVDCRDTAALGLSGGAYMPVVKMTVQVPFTEWFSDVLGLGDLTFRVAHEEVHIGE